MVCVQVLCVRPGKHSMRRQNVLHMIRISVYYPKRWTHSTGYRRHVRPLAHLSAKKKNGWTCFVSSSGFRCVFHKSYFDLFAFCLCWPLSKSNKEDPTVLLSLFPLLPSPLPRKTFIFTLSLRYTDPQKQSTPRYCLGHVDPQTNCKRMLPVIQSWLSDSGLRWAASSTRT